MAISFISSPSFRLPVVLVVLAFAACSGGDEGENPGDGSEPVDGQTAGAGGSDAVDAPAAGAGGAEPGEPGSAGVGNVGATVSQGGSTSTSTGGSEPAVAGAGGEQGPEPEPPSEAFLRGKELVEKNECVTCHQANFAGFTVFPNITPDEKTGIGSWTDEQIIAAIRNGVDVDGSTMCPTMMRYSFSDEEGLDIVAFLRGIPAVSNKVSSVCPGHGD